MVVAEQSTQILQFYCNGYSALARKLSNECIEYFQQDNAFLRIADLERAQQLADAFGLGLFDVCPTRVEGR
jgi:hypothetical protein